jgi:hypothetical protein
MPSSRIKGIAEEGFESGAGAFRFHQAISASEP